MNNRYLLRLRDDFNPEEVKEFTEYLATRLCAYQFGTFYDYMLKVDKGAMSFTHEFVQGYTNQLAGDKKEDFHKFLFTIKATEKNKAPKQNNGAKELSIDWVFSLAFIDLFDLNKVAIVNTEDLSFTDREACFFGRSVIAVLVQNFYNERRDIVERNFEVLKANDPANSKSVNELLSKQRDLCLTRTQTLELLQAKKCVITGAPLSDILKPEFTLA